MACASQYTHSELIDLQTLQTFQLFVACSGYCTALAIQRLVRYVGRAEAPLIRWHGDKICVKFALRSGADLNHVILSLVSNVSGQAQSEVQAVRTGKMLTEVHQRFRLPFTSCSKRPCSLVKGQFSPIKYA